MLDLLPLDLPERQLHHLMLHVDHEIQIAFLGNRPQEPKAREVEFFPIEEVLNEEIKIQRQPNH